ncbi:MAG: plasmid stabilization system [Sediminibacterium sp.]|nr:plasmid stabilization system [Sediminibacterium sp.]
MANTASYSAVISSRAQKEITAAWAWYEDRQQGLGDRFVKELTGRIHKIEQTPNRYPTRYKSYKEAPVPVFPYLVIYRLSGTKNIVWIVSVFHTSLNPKKKYK